jgi:hypothetical protein
MFYAPRLVFQRYRGIKYCFHVLRFRTHFRRYRGRRVLFSCFVLPNSFSALPRVQGPNLMFSAPKLIFIGTEGLDSHIHVFRSRTRFRKYRGRRVPFSCSALPNSFSAVPWATGSVFIFCSPGLVFNDRGGVGSRFHVLLSRTRFRRYHGLQVPFACFALPSSFSAVPNTSGPVFMFCSPKFVLVGIMGVGSLFDVLRSRARFRRFRGRQVQFSCLALPDSFLAVPRESGPVFMFRAPEHILGGTVGVGSFFHGLRCRTRFRRYRGRGVLFLGFVLPNSFSAVPMATGPVFIFCAPGLIFGGTEIVGSRFHVWRTRISFRQFRGRQVQFHVYRSRTHFRRYRGRRVPFSCYALSNSFLAVPRASGSVFMFSSPGLVFGGT